MGMSILAQSPGKPLSVGAAGVLRRREQGSAAFPGAWPLQPCVSSCTERSCLALCVPGARLQDGAVGWLRGAAATTLPDSWGVYLRGPEEIPYSAAAFQSSALSWDLCWYKTSTASPFTGEPGLCPWLPGCRDRNVLLTWLF